MKKEFIFIWVLEKNFFPLIKMSRRRGKVTIPTQPSTISLSMISIPNRGDLIDIWTSKTPSTTYEVKEASKLKSGIIEVILKISGDDENKDEYVLEINLSGKKYIPGSDVQYNFSEFRKPVSVPVRSLVGRRVSKSVREKSPERKSLSQSENLEQLKQDPYIDLPKDIILEIALRTELKTISKLCQSSKRFNDIICLNDLFWKDKYYQDVDPRFRHVEEWPEFKNKKTWREKYQLMIDWTKPVLFESIRVGSHTEKVVDWFPYIDSESDKVMDPKTGQYIGIRRPYVSLAQKNKKMWGTGRLSYFDPLRRVAVLITLSTNNFYLLGDRKLDEPLEEDEAFLDPIPEGAILKIGVITFDSNQRNQHFDNEINKDRERLGLPKI